MSLSDIRCIGVSLCSCQGYSCVNAPTCSCVLGMELASAFMFWSNIPLYAFAITAAAYAVKIPIEVNFLKSRLLAASLTMIEDDTEVGIEYMHYTSHVRSRIIPYIW